MISLDLKMMEFTYLTVKVEINNSQQRLKNSMGLKRPNGQVLMIIPGLLPTLMMTVN